MGDLAMKDYLWICGVEVRIKAETEVVSGLY